MSKRTIPITPWRAETQWKPSPGNFTILTLGLYIFGTGEAFFVESGLGNGPWTVLAQGISNYLPLTLGWTTFILSALVLLIWIPFRQKPGVGTVMNTITIAFALGVGINVVPQPKNPIIQISFCLLGLLLIGLGSALYLSCGLGPGPRDGLMTAIHLRWNMSIPMVRTSIEITVLLCGFLLGGHLGLGTLIFALGIGWSLGLWLFILQLFVDRVF